jgi:hypothetical protein
MRRMNNLVAAEVVPVDPHDLRTAHHRQRPTEIAHSTDEVRTVYAVRLRNHKLGQNLG